MLCSSYPLAVGSMRVAQLRAGTPAPPLWMRRAPLGSLPNTSMLAVTALCPSAPVMLTLQAGSVRLKSTLPVLETPAADTLPSTWMVRAVSVVETASPV